MIIGIDGNEANVTNRVGINTYAFELLWAIYNLHNEWDQKHRLIVYLREKPLSDLPQETDFFQYKILKGQRQWILTQLTPRVLLNREKLNVLFTPSHYVPVFSTVPRVCAIMDLGYLKFSDQFKRGDYWQLNLWSAYSIFVSKYVISISEATKKDIMRHYKSASRKIRVTQLAYDKNRFNESTKINNMRHIKNRYSIVNDYILFISTLKPSKNIEGLIKAFAQIADEFPTLQLVIAGKKGWLFESIFEEVKKYNLVDRIVFTDFVPEEDKPALIKGAKMLVLPSFWEGFGLDALEALACGVPAVVSNVASLPEVVGDAGILVDPYKSESIAHGMKSVLNLDKASYNKLVAKGIAQAANFSWEKTARETLAVLESVK